MVQVTNADEKKSNEKSVRPKGLISSSSKGADKSWILPTAIAIPVGVVAVTAAAASCFILHKHHACCFRNGAKGNGAMMEVNMAAPVYD
ncbi:MAG TPA: hypothetical protein PLQ04_04035 [Lachnospiraceae bacterium]|nr:hypothetical protein [Lachnospiraceae bacterium]